MASSSNNPNVAIQRLQKELMDLMTDGGDAGVTAFPHDDDLFRWDATLTGPTGTYYEGIEYRLSIEFTAEYPFAAPKVRFVTPCFHPNVALTGAICLDILGEAWSAVMSVGTVLLSLQSLLETPNNNSPLNENAARLWRNAALMRNEVLRSAGHATTEASATAAPASPPSPPTSNGGGAGGPSESNHHTNAADSVVGASTAASSGGSTAAIAAAPSPVGAAVAVGMSPQEQRRRSHRHETGGGAQTQPPHAAAAATA